ncbi:MAG: bifunctional shikimate kinase/3-dehydroquinate synthase [Kofleriaceae bacterium]
MPALFLIGFMAAGKSTVGALLAKKRGRRFVDLDDHVDPQILKTDEAEFRRQEAAALLAAISDDVVIATGGGAAAYGDNLEKMKAAGCVIALDVDVATAKARAVGGAERPLLARGDDAVRRLAAERAPIYRRAHAVVSTTGRAIEDVVDDVDHVERVFTRVRSVDSHDVTIVALGARSYPIVVGPGFHEDAIRAVVGTGRVAAISDSNVSALWNVGLPTTVMPAGEPHKTLATYERLTDDLIPQLDRGSTIVALGGGVVGDMAGFVAATMFRGIAIVQVPTTIVAMTDAAIGGKTAVDTRAGKNLLGAFHQPKLVACNTDTLKTLPDRERRAGFGELWKYALLDGEHLWTLVDACAAWSRGGGAMPREMNDVIARSVAYKAAVVGADEQERGNMRVLLNLGHTVGHAIESEHGLVHGESVGLGLVVACRVSRELGFSDLETRVADALARSGLPHDPRAYLSEATIARISVDKKRSGNSVRFIAIREVGACEPVELPLQKLGEILRAYASA